MLARLSRSERRELVGALEHSGSAGEGSQLHAARRIYPRPGFRLVEEQRHHSFGHDQVSQTRELELR